MTRTTRPAAYIRVAPDSLTTALVAQRSAVYQAARGRGWAEPTMYIHVDGADGHDDCSDWAQPVLARLTTAISTGQHDVLLIGVGTICAFGVEMAALLASCTRHGVAVECITAPATVTCGTDGSRSHPQP